MDDFDDYTELEQEEGITGAYCPDCNTTYTLGWVSYLGGRESEPITCPDCRRPLEGNIETEWTVEKRTPGNVLHRLVEA